jgi:hypothetical protein
LIAPLLHSPDKIADSTLQLLAVLSGVLLYCHSIYATGSAFLQKPVARGEILLVQVMDQGSELQLPVSPRQFSYPREFLRRMFHAAL